MSDQPWLQERIDHPLGGGKHTFKISVVMRGDGADYEGVLTTVLVQQPVILEDEEPS